MDQSRERGNENEEQQDDYGDASESNKRIILQRFTLTMPQLQCT